MVLRSSSTTINLNKAIFGEEETMSKYQKFILMSFSIACIISIITCVIVNVAIDRQITWSVYPILSVLFGWLVFSPLIIKKHGLPLSICSLTLFTLPYLFFLDKITPVESWFIPLGIPSAIAGMISVWVFYLLFRFVKISLWYKLAIAVFIAGAIVSPIINSYVDVYLNAEPRLLNTIINIASSVILSAAIAFLGYRRNLKRAAPWLPPEG